MSDYYSPKDDKVDFKQIALGHYKKILEITTNEFIGGFYNYIQTANTTNKVYVPDKRAEFTQAVESLALALYPHFDEEMKRNYKEFQSKAEELSKKYKDANGNIGMNKLSYSIALVELMKLLFRDLSSLMYRLDYFKTASYSEGDLDDIVDVDGREINKTKEEVENG